MAIHNYMVCILILIYVFVVFKIIMSKVGKET